MMGKVQRTPPTGTPTKSASESDNDNKKQRLTQESLVKDPVQILTARQRRRRAQEDEKCDCASASEGIKMMIADMMAKHNERMDRLENHLKDLKIQGENDSKEIKRRVDLVQNSNKHIEESLEFLTDQINLFDGKIEVLSVQYNEMSKQVQHLEEKCANMERFTLKTAVEIRNVPKKPTETKDNLLQTVQYLANSLNTTLENSELKDIYRLPGKPTSPTSAIVVEFTNTWSKGRFLNAVKLYRKSKSDQLNTTHLGFKGQTNPVYISERLSVKAKRLHFLARELAKSENYAHCWVTNGKVFLRKQDGAPYIFVKSEDHLHSLRTTQAK